MRDGGFTGITAQKPNILQRETLKVAIVLRRNCRNITFCFEKNCNRKPANIEEFQQLDRNSVCAGASKRNVIVEVEYPLGVANARDHPDKRCPLSEQFINTKHEPSMEPVWDRRKTRGCKHSCKIKNSIKKGIWGGKKTRVKGNKQFQRALYFH